MGRAYEGQHIADNEYPSIGGSGKENPVLSLPKPSLTTHQDH